MAKKTYEQRSDLEKCRSQWHKLRGLHSREEWSAAIVRAATAAEIAANYAIRREFASRGKLSASFVDSLLRWANGLKGKIDHLLLPVVTEAKKKKALRQLVAFATEVNEHRNSIVHRGEFRNEDKATELIAKAEKFVLGLVRIYKPSFKLPKET
jgi:hypothetical protein